MRELVRRTPSPNPLILLAVAAPESRAALTAKLAQNECRYRVATTVDEFDVCIASESISMIIVDVEFHGRPGVELCRDYQNRLNGTPVVLFTDCTAEAMEKAIEAVRQNDVDVLLSPPGGRQIERLVQAARHYSANNHEPAFAADRALSADGRSAVGPPSEIRRTEVPTNRFSLPERSDLVNCSATVEIRKLADLPASSVDAANALWTPSDDEPAEIVRHLESVLIGVSPAMAAIRHTIADVAGTRATVMIHGESGTGKELVARAIHHCSQRFNGPFVPVNMAAIPQGLAESLLFGHKKGAFTSASASQTGWCQAADRGTLFLDEVGEMEISVQPKLLRFLQEGVVQPVGSQQSVRVDARIVTATNRDPASIVQEGRMREDLFFRLHVVPIEMPPLRDRPEDIAILAEMFLQISATAHGRNVDGFTEETLEILRSFDWPGNVRQLQNTVERMVIFTRGRVVEACQIPVDIQVAAALAPPTIDGRSTAVAGNMGGRLPTLQSRLTPLQRQERVLIINALDRTNGHVIKAARLLRLGQATVYRKIRQYEISRSRFRAPRNPR